MRAGTFSPAYLSVYCGPPIAGAVPPASFVPPSAVVAGVVVAVLAAESAPDAFAAVLAAVAAPVAVSIVPFAAFVQAVVVSAVLAAVSFVPVAVSVVVALVFAVVVPASSVPAAASAGPEAGWFCRDFRAEGTAGFRASADSSRQEGWLAGSIFPAERCSRRARDWDGRELQPLLKLRPGLKTRSV